MNTNVLHMKTNSILRALLASAAGLALPAFGQINTSDFSTASGLQLNGDASIVGSALRLTPAAFFQAGSAFTASTITLAPNVSFSSFFTFRISGSDGAGDDDGPGADGFAFVVQTNSNNSLGIGGGGLGYLGIPNSLGVEFDTYGNGPGLGDPDGNHVNFNFGGAFSPAGNAAIIPTRLNNGNIWSAWVDYNGATNALELRLVEGSLLRPLAPVLSTTVDLATVFGSSNTFVGFTGGTGGGFENHDILSWEFRDTFAPITSGLETVPEPSTYSAFGAALLFGAVAFRRRRKHC